MDDVRDYWTGIGLILIKRLEKKYRDIFGMKSIFYTIGAKTYYIEDGEFHLLDVQELKKLSDTFGMRFMRTLDHPDPLCPVSDIRATLNDSECH